MYIREKQASLKSNILYENQIKYIKKLQRLSNNASKFEEQKKTLNIKQ